MPELEQQQRFPTLPTQSFRLDVPLHAILKDPKSEPVPVRQGPTAQGKTLP